MRARLRVGTSKRSDQKPSVAGWIWGRRWTRRVRRRDLDVQLPAQWIEAKAPPIPRWTPEGRHVVGGGAYVFEEGLHEAFIGCMHRLELLDAALVSSEFHVADVTTENPCPQQCGSAA